MIFPYSRTPKPKPVAMLRRDRTVVDESGTISTISEAPERSAIFADRDIANEHLHRGDGVAVCWNGVPIRWEVDGRSIYLLGSYPGDGARFLDALVRLRDFLTAHDASIGSLTASSYSLLRASLSRPILSWGGERPPITEVIGGRQEAFVPPGHYGEFEGWDLSAAYARTLGELIYPGSWTVWSDLPAEGSPYPCFVSATVSVPRGARIGPLPRRRRKPDPDALWRRLEDRDYPVNRRISGVWSAEEIRAAQEAGAGVKIRRVWMMSGHPRAPFGSWWSAIQEARSLPGLAGAFGKTMGNTLWGRFISLGDRTRVSYDTEGRPTTVPAPLPARPRESQGLDAAELVTAHVRARLYREVMLPHAERLISVHTDGALLFPGPEPELPSDWRCKDRGQSLIFLGPQAYAYRRMSGTPVYKVSGVNPRHVRAVFASLSKSVLRLPATLRPTTAKPDEDAWKTVR